MLRWLSCSSIPEAYAAISETDKQWAEASTFAVWWQRAEDYILRSWQMWVLQRPVKHLSLHFDGLRLDRARVQSSHGSVEDFNLAAASQIAEDTGFRVAIAEKKHRTFLDLLGQEADVQDASLSGDARLLLADGNCVPVTLALHAAGLMALVAEKIAAATRALRARAPRPRAERY